MVEDGLPRMLLNFLHTEEAFVLIERVSTYDCHYSWFSSLCVFECLSLFHLILSSMFPEHVVFHHALWTNHLFRNLGICLFLSSFRMSYNSSTLCSGASLTSSGTHCHIESAVITFHLPLRQLLPSCKLFRFDPLLVVINIEKWPLLSGDGKTSHCIYTDIAFTGDTTVRSITVPDV